MGIFLLKSKDMKTILIATDFSKASRNASIYGLHLAKAINAKVILFSAYQIPSPPTGLGMSISRYDVMEQTRQKLMDEEEKITYINMPEIKTICDEGVAGDAIINMANEKKADFIITGMKGSGKSFKKIFGSTATSLAKNSKIPVIIIPEDAKFKNPDTLIFASDNIIDADKNALEQLITITKLFKSKLFVVKVIKNKNEEWFEVSDTPQELRKVFEILDSSIEYPVDTDVTHALNKFIKKHDADMLVMMPHKHDWLERLFIKSETKDMIFHSQIPLLVLPEGQIKERSGSETLVSSENTTAY